MNKTPTAPPAYGPPPAAPPSYAQAVGGVPPTSPYVPQHTFFKDSRIVTTVVPVGLNATHMICPHCHAEIESSTSKKPGMLALISGALLCIFGCFCGCCLIPCCIEDCMEVMHTCPNCKAYLGMFRSPRFHRF